MPNYEYLCKCGKQFEVFRSLKDMKQKERCKCGKMAKKLFSANPTHFKSRGFPGNDSKISRRSRGDQFVDNKVEDMFDDHNYGKKYGMQKDEHGLR